MGGAKKQKLKILHVVAKLDAGGAEKTALVLSSVFVQRSHQVSIMVYEDGGEFEKYIQPGIELISLHREWKFNPLKLLKMAGIFKKFDVIHLHMGHTLRYAFLSQLFGLVPSSSRFFFHDQYGLIELSHKIGFFLRLGIQRNFYIGGRSTLIESILAKTGKNPTEVFYLGNYVKSFPKSGIKKEQGRIALVSNFRFEKNMELAINLIGEFADQGIQLDIYGQIVDKDYYQKIAELISSSGLGDQVRIITTETNIQSVLPRYHFAIHTSRTEVYPLVILEYLAEGVPFLFFNAGEMTQLLAGSLRDFYIGDLELSSWKDGFTRMMSAPVDAHKDQIQDFYRKNYSEEKYYEECLQIYHQALGY